MKKYSPYPAYKDSGVEWLGRVPEHWGVIPLKRALRLISDRGARDDRQVALENIESWTGRLIPNEANYAGTGIAFEPGDLLFGKLRPYLAKVLLAQEAGSAVGDFFVMRPTGQVISRYAQLLLLDRAFIEVVNGSTYGTKMPRASWEFMGGMPLSLPPVEEQIAIASEVDVKTTRIEALIAKKVRFIELLQEKRQALVTHAVTRGLNPDAPMKDSGVEWIGGVPAHWNTLRVRHVSSSVGGGTPEKSNLAYWGGSIPWVTPKDMKRENIDSSEDMITEAGYQASSTARIAPGAVLIVFRSGILQHTIPVAINTTEVVVNQDMRAFSFKEYKKVLPDFFLRYVQGLNDSLLMLWRKEGATVESIDTERMNSSRMPVPPLAEQQAIIDYLATATLRINTLITKTQRSIELLQERRAALITAAVTGQIDLREAA